MQLIFTDEKGVTHYFENIEVVHCNANKAKTRTIDDNGNNLIVISSNSSHSTKSIISKK